MRRGPVTSPLLGPVLGPVLGLVLCLALTGCTGDDGGGEQPTPAEVLAAAKEHLDSTSGVRIRIATEELPAGVTGVTAGEGVVVPPDGFEGSFELRVSGLPAEVEVIATDGVTYARNPLLLPQWTEIDPAEYGAPDPGRLLAPDGGLSGILTETADPAAGESVRGGESNDEILTEYTGTVPGQALTGFLPTSTGDFDATYTVTDDHELREAVLTGEFYGGSEPVTYTITFSEYGLEQDVTAP